MKKLGLMLLALFFIVAFPQEGQAASGSPKIILDGQELTLTGNARVENVKGNIMIPIRVVSEKLGFGVGWDQKSKTVTISQKDTILKLVVNQTNATVNGETVALNMAPLLRTDTVLVPIRFVSEQMNHKVSWNNTTKTVTIESPKVPDTEVEPPGGSDGSTTPSNLHEVTSISFSENRLLISLSGAITPKSFTMTGPDRIVLDIPNAKFSDEFLYGQAWDAAGQGSLVISGNTDVAGVRYSMFSDNPSTVRVVVDLTSSKAYKTYSEGNLFIVDLNMPQPDGSIGGSGKKIVVIDAGHGDGDPGAIGVTGKKEKDFNLAIALKVEKLMKKEQNIDVVLTRSDDTFLELKERAKIANDLNADVFISIHANASSSSSASGTETYYKKEDSKAFAAIMQKYLAQATGLNNRGVKYGNFHVIRETKMPAILLEVGYLSNKKDEQTIFTESVQNKVAEAVVKATKEYLQIK